MDSLDRIVGSAGPLLRRVDEMLSAAGAPADHRVWAELRRVRLLPGDAVHAVVALRSEELAGAAPELRSDAQAYGELAKVLPASGSWSGTAAEAYDDARKRAADRLSGALDSLDERLEATADLADALVDWMGQTRGDLAGTLARVLTSSEAVALSSGHRLDVTAEPQIQAAAAVAERILQTVADSYELAADLLYSSAELAEPIRA
jgi:hypothetical protein